jgi:hypothetical protein
MEEQQFVTDFILNNLKELTSEVKWYQVLML